MWLTSPVNVSVFIWPTSLNYLEPPSTYPGPEHMFRAQPPQMRMCINALGKQADTPSAICAFMRKVYEGFQRLPESACGRETRRKVQVMRNSLRKVEDGEKAHSEVVSQIFQQRGRFVSHVWPPPVSTALSACYTLKVRGAELPKERLSEALEAFSAAAAPERE